MLASYPFDSTALNQNPGLGSANTQKNIALRITLGDTVIQVEPGQAGSSEIPAKILRNSGAYGSGLIPTNTGRGPHQDYMFIKESSEYTYTTRALVGGSVVEKQMTAGAVVGQEGRMILYKGCTTIADSLNGNWTERLIRPFLITAADLANRETGWPLSGAVPTIDVASKSVVDNGGNGYNHI